MGYTYEINVWDGPIDGDYKWLQIYCGESVLKAVYYMWWAKRNGWLCIKLEWRP
jgi:hypothetical protein